MKNAEHTCEDMADSAEWPDAEGQEKLLRCW